MHRLIKPLFWTFLFLVMMLVIDQFLVQVPPVHPAHAAVSNFYQDFRSRLIDLTFGEKKIAPKSVEAVIEEQQKNKKPSLQKVKNSGQEQAKPANRPQVKESQRYLYADGKGELPFADSLEEVPDEYRGHAQPMGK
ncbi:MAG: hypothetical protein GQ530_07235 [Desulfuromonadales bacterium]|nr:hypothetical protein [Desulfuromonadales bacterium]